MAEPLLTSEELARHLGVDENTVYRWSRAGRVPALKVGRWWRFRLGEVEAALAREPRHWHDLSRPLSAALERGDHLVAYDLEPGLARRLERAFVAAGLERGAIVVRVGWGPDGGRRARSRAEVAPDGPGSGALPVSPSTPRAVSGETDRVVAFDASSVPVGRAEAALREWSSSLRKRFGGKRDIWIYGSPLPPSRDSRIARLEATLMKLAPREGWVVLCLYGRAALPERARLADVHTGELAATPDEVKVLVARR